MNTIIESIKDAFLARVKNPIIGTFIISFLLFNYRIILEFVFLDNKNKIELLHTIKFDYVSDITYPILITLGYLYLLPLLNFFHESLFDLKLDEIRTNNKQKYLLRYYEKQTEIALEKMKSQDQYVSKILEEGLANWSKQKKELQEQIFNLKTQLADPFLEPTRRGFDLNKLDLEVSLKAANDKIEKLSRENVELQKYQALTKVSK